MELPVIPENTKGQQASQGPEDLNHQHQFLTIYTEDNMFFLSAKPTNSPLAQTEAGLFPTCAPITNSRDSTGQRYQCNFTWIGTGITEGII